jgi:hypothetical protein
MWIRCLPISAQKVNQLQHRSIVVVYANPIQPHNFQECSPFLSKSNFPITQNLSIHPRTSSIWRVLGNVTVSRLWSKCRPKLKLFSLLGHRTWLLVGPPSSSDGAFAYTNKQRLMRLDSVRKETNPLLIPKSIQVCDPVFYLLNPTFYRLYIYYINPTYWWLTLNSWWAA